MKLTAKVASLGRRPQTGFSLVELVLSLAVLLIITTIAVPVVVRSLQTYQLNSAASQLAGMLKFTKFDAIRQNTKVSCQIKHQPDGSWLVWVDSNGNLQPDGGEPQMVITGTNTLLPDGSPVPSPSPIIATLGPGFSKYSWVVLSGSNGSITYDQRGVIDASAVYVLYLGIASGANASYRAIVTLPSGAVQVWSSSSAGDWHRVS
jgi:prepilin-type N-terminal cleavage/methylation domain-containing protein